MPTVSVNNPCTSLFINSDGSVNDDFKKISTFGGIAVASQVVSTNDTTGVPLSPVSVFQVTPVVAETIATFSSVLQAGQEIPFASGILGTRGVTQEKYPSLFFGKGWGLNSRFPMIQLDVPRNLVFTGQLQPTSARGSILVEGFDSQFNFISETFLNTDVFGKKTFAFINRISVLTNGSLSDAETIVLKSGNNVGLPYYTGYLGQILSVSYGSTIYDPSIESTVGDGLRKIGAIILGSEDGCDARGSVCLKTNAGTATDSLSSELLTLCMYVPGAIPTNIANNFNVTKNDVFGQV